MPALATVSGIVSITPSSQSIVRVVVATPVTTLRVIAVPDFTEREVGVTVNPGSNVVVLVEAVVDVVVVDAVVDVVVVDAAVADTDFVPWWNR